MPFPCPSEDSGVAKKECATSKQEAEKRVQSRVRDSFECDPPCVKNVRIDKTVEVGDCQIDESTSGKLYDVHYTKICSKV